MSQHRLPAGVGGQGHSVCVIAQVLSQGTRQDLGPLLPGARHGVAASCGSDTALWGRAGSLFRGLSAEARSSRAGSPRAPEMHLPVTRPQA